MEFGLFRHQKWLATLPHRWNWIFSDAISSDAGALPNTICTNTIAAGAHSNVRKLRQLVRTSC